MNDEDIERLQIELDRLLNDPDVPMQPERIWSLLAVLAAAADSRPALAVTPS